MIVKADVTFLHEDENIAMPQTKRATTVFAQYLAIIQMSSSEEASFIDISSYLSEMGIAHKHKLET